MIRASALFDEQARARIQAAVAEAERMTSGEIVPVVATASGDYDRAEDLVGLWFALLGLVVLYWIALPASATGDWGARATVSFGWPGLLLALAVIVVGFLIGAVLASHVGWIRRLLTPQAFMRRCVEQAAARVFFELGVRGTCAQTGILIYVSLFEHRVLVSGDKAIAAKFAPEDWVEVRDRILAGLRRGQPTEGLVAGIKRCGELLGEHLPIAPDDVNELANDLILID